ncbi:MAG: nuclear transport factor 2 family protein, partial [Calditrichaeota bacterium]|nr:nuclear transport factor 2 family protein [Calditrichota bacterium]
MRHPLPLLLLTLLAVSCSGPAPAPTQDNATIEAAHQAHDAYVNAINSNDLATLLGMLTDDVVYMAPHETPMLGKSEVAPWLESYLGGWRTNWDKPVQEFVVSGEWAFERYSYTSTNISLADGSVVVDTGWGLAIYHHDAD